jgi:hypothetical protein
MKQNAPVKIAIYDVFGKEISVLVNGTETQGDHTLEINAATLSLAPGIYFCSMQSSTFTQNIKICVAQ